MELVKSKYTTLDFSSIFDFIEDSTDAYQMEYKNKFKRSSNCRKHQGVLDELNKKSKKCKSQSYSSKYMEEWLHNRSSYLDSIWK